MLMLLRQDVELEERVQRIYGEVAEEVSDDKLTELFERGSRDAGGHVRGLQRVIREIERGEHEVRVFCPRCGGAISFGQSPEEDALAACPTCDVRVRLRISEGDYVLEEA